MPERRQASSHHPAIASGIGYPYKIALESGTQQTLLAARANRVDYYLPRYLLNKLRDPQLLTGMDRVAGEVVSALDGGDRGAVFHADPIKVFSTGDGVGSAAGIPAVGGRRI